MPAKSRSLPAGQRVAEQQPLEPEAPRVLVRRGQAEARAMRARRCPSGSALRAPSARTVSRSPSVRPKRRRTAASSRIAEHAVRVVAAAGQLEQRQNVAASVLSCSALRSETLNGMRGSRGAEDRFDVRRVGLDVRRHHDDVRRLEIGVRAEEREQLIVQHLDFAHRAVARMDLHASGRPARHRRASARARADRGCRTGSTRAGSRRPARRSARSARPPSPSISASEIEEVAALLAERGEQAVAGLEIARLGLARERLARDVACVADVAPVFAAGVLHEEMHVAVPRERGEELEQRRRQRRRAEDRDALGQRAGRGTVPRASALRSCACNAARCGAPASCASRCHSAACQCGALAALPRGDPVGPIDEIFVVELRRAARQARSAAA